MQVLLSELEAAHRVSIVEVRLVRLWPFAPHRTRGNAALAALVEVEMTLNEFQSVLEPLFRYLITDDIEVAGLDAQPALVVSPGQPDSRFYLATVSGLVTTGRAMRSLLEANGLCLYSEQLGDRGVIGAVAAISWPAARCSWELTAWRDEKMIRSHRILSEAAIDLMIETHPNTFLNRDPRQCRSIIAPRTPCPVLYGIRGDSSSTVEAAHAMLQAESGVEISCSHRSHRTNQTTDDHLSEVRCGTVLSRARCQFGGHAALSVITEAGLSRLVAFKQGGAVNRLLRIMQVGDRIEWVGLESPDGSIHLERIRLSDASPRLGHRPLCDCGGRLKSAGAAALLRCRRCGRTGPRRWLTNSAPPVDWVEPAAADRRHLARPLAHGPPATSERNDATG